MVTGVVIILTAIVIAIRNGAGSIFTKSVGVAKKKLRVDRLRRAAVNETDVICVVSWY